MNELLVLLLPLAAFSGWWLARTDNKFDDSQKADDYFKGLGYLLEDKTDKAIDIFVRIAHLDDSTIENQITLGNIFRYRGEIDRALHIHSNLANKGELSPATRQKLNLALADDYLAAGIMNHAETHYRRVSEDTHPDLRDLARRRLVKLYAEQSLWQQAIEVGEELDPFKRDDIQQHIAHYHCEIAKALLAKGETKPAVKRLQQALDCDKNCVRATLKLGRLAIDQKNYVEAISQFNRLERQNPAFLPEILADLSTCYTALNQQHEWKIALKRLAKTYNNPVLALSYNKLVAATDGAGAARDYLRQRLQERPNILTIQAYLQLTDKDDNHGDIHLLNASIDKVLSYALKYRCNECGFRGNQLNWQCPGCKQWGTFMPVSDVSLKENVGYT